MKSPARILVTGAEGFIGKNLVLRLRELPGFEVVTLTRADSAADLARKVSGIDAVVHLAGSNRPQDPAEFARVNTGLTEALCEQLAAAGRPVKLLLASSAQAALDNPYGLSKRAAEDVVGRWAAAGGGEAVIYRLPGVFGKWCRPDYNSVVATFCRNVAEGRPLRIDAPERELTLVYVDDVVDQFLRELGTPPAAAGSRAGHVAPEHRITLGELAERIQSFRDARHTLMIPNVGTGLTRGLYATYVSVLGPEAMAYDVPVHGDARGSFVEMLKTREAGQFSYFTAHPGVTRGGHYHHTKTEKFLVLKGRALFRFRHLLTGQTHELTTEGGQPRIVDTVPGWTHDITNTGDDELVVMLWANEVFDRERPDTIANKV